MQSLLLLAATHVVVMTNPRWVPHRIQNMIVIPGWVVVIDEYKLCSISAVWNPLRVDDDRCC